jgi:hypothetical protein
MARLTKEQELALAELFGPAAHGQPAPAAPQPAPDLAETWLGVSSADLGGPLRGLLAGKDGLEAQALEWIERHPLDSAFEFLSGAALAFYLAEKEANPRVKTYVDAFYYIATCASVGYADVFAATQPGRAIAGLVMIVGPALTSKALDPPAAE